MVKQKFDIAIVGAGLIGSALALWLAKHSRFSIALIERNSLMREPSEANERVVALGSLAGAFLADIDIAQKLGEEHRHAYQRMHVWDENSDGELGFDASMVDSMLEVSENENVASQYLGHMTDSPYCNHLCQQAVLENSQIETYFDTQLLSLEMDGDRLILSSDEQELSANLIIAADGVNSWVRQAAKIFANHRDYHQRGIVARIFTKEPHEDCAWQRFLSTGPLAILPLANNQSSIVWSANNAFADELLALSNTEFEHRLELALQGRLGEVEILAERRAFPLRSLRAESYYKRGLVLVGDAAHSIHPLAGQGANLGFKDILCLGELIIAAESSRDLSSPRLLARYQSKRQADNNQTDALMSALHGAYQNDWPVWMAARGLGMNALNRSTRMRQLLVRQAIGF